MFDKLNAFFQKDKHTTVTPQAPITFESFFASVTSKVPEQPSTDSFDFFGKGTGARMNEAQKLMDRIAAPYLNTMAEYIHASTPEKWEFFKNDPDQGYKFHLNVEPEHIRQVAAFLKMQDYEHKYLSGGDIQSGKIFTVYTGSKAQTERIVREVVDSEVSPLLTTPLADKTGGEVAYAKNIVGRFVGNRHSFLTKFASQGITLLRDTEKLNPQVAFSLADKALRQQYGDYYGGGITFYTPSTHN